MRMVLQRVSSADVKVENKLVGEIGIGLLILMGIEESDTEDDINWITQKVIQMRIFSDNIGKMNLSLQDVKGSILLISQFTLYALTKKGNRPSFIRAARPDLAIPLYEKTIQKFKELGISIETGIFGADMQVSLVNDGPVTIIVDSKNKE